MKLCIHIVEKAHGKYTAVCPSLPGCMCGGRTREEARRKLEDAICGYIAAVSDFVPENLSHMMMEV